MLLFGGKKAWEFELRSLSHTDDWFSAVRSRGQRSSDAEHSVYLAVY